MGMCGRVGLQVRMGVCGRVDLQMQGRAEADDCGRERVDLPTCWHADADERRGKRKKK